MKTRSQYMEFLVHLCDNTSFIEETEQGQVTLWCTLPCGLNVPRHEIFGVWDPTTGHVNYNWFELHEPKPVQVVEEKPKKLTIMSAIEEKRLHDSVQADFRRRASG